MELLDALFSGRVLLMDGATGTELQRAGAADGECLELWNLTRPSRVRAVHRSYLEAGAACLVTNTFQAGRRALLAKGVSERDWTLVNKLGVELARVAGDRSAAELAPREREHFVLASVGPPAADLDPEAAAADCLEQMQLLAGADGILLETQGNLPFVAAVLRQASSVVGRMPILVSIAFADEGRDLACRPSWANPEAVARFAEAARPQLAALGVNCGRDIGMDQTADIVRRYRRATDLPLFARPNAGSPTRTDRDWVYPLGPDEMAKRLPELLAAGVRMVGGCCGTTPEHVAAMRPVVEEWNAKTSGPA